MHHFLVSLLALLALCYLEACETSGDDASEGDIARCRVLCEDQKSCPGADTDEDCTTYCVSLDSIIIAGRCRVRYQLLLDCDEALVDLCDEPTECATERGDFDTCTSEYCSDHADECADVFGPS